jgi:hypothetical protein
MTRLLKIVETQDFASLLNAIYVETCPSIVEGRFPLEMTEETAYLGANTMQIAAA